MRYDCKAAILSSMYAFWLIFFPSVMMVRAPCMSPTHMIDWIAMMMMILNMVDMMMILISKVYPFYIFKWQHTGV